MSEPTDQTDPIRIAFMCVQNAGRSQMSVAFAEREREQRGLDHVEILTGGTHPADSVHEEVVDVRDWALDDPDGNELDRVRKIRDEIECRVSALFDEVS